MDSHGCINILPCRSRPENPTALQVKGVLKHMRTEAYRSNILFHAIYYTHLPFLTLGDNL